MKMPIETLALRYHNAQRECKHQNIAIRYIAITCGLLEHTSTTTKVDFLAVNDTTSTNGDTTNGLMVSNGAGVW